MTKVIDLAKFPDNDDDYEEYLRAFDQLKEAAEQELPEDREVEPTAEDMERYYKHFEHIDQDYLDYGMGRDNEFGDGALIHYLYEKRKERVKKALYGALPEQQDIS